MEARLLDCIMRNMRDLKSSASVNHNAVMTNYNYIFWCVALREFAFVDINSVHIGRKLVDDNICVKISGNY